MGSPHQIIVPFICARATCQFRRRTRCFTHHFPVLNTPLSRFAPGRYSLAVAHRMELVPMLVDSLRGEAMPEELWVAVTSIVETAMVCGLLLCVRAPAVAALQSAHPLHTRAHTHIAALTCSVLLLPISCLHDQHPICTLPQSHNHSLLHSLILSQATQSVYRRTSPPCPMPSRPLSLRTCAHYPQAHSLLHGDVHAVMAAVTATLPSNIAKAELHQVHSLHYTRLFRCCTGAPCYYTAGLHCCALLLCSLPAVALCSAAL
jgi:hypothetical protein